MEQGDDHKKTYYIKRKTTATGDVLTLISYESRSAAKKKLAELQEENAPPLEGLKPIFYFYISINKGR